MISKEKIEKWYKTKVKKPQYDMFYSDALDTFGSVNSLYNSMASIHDESITIDDMLLYNTEKEKISLSLVNQIYDHMNDTDAYDNLNHDEINRLLGLIENLIPSVYSKVNTRPDKDMFFVLKNGFAYVKTML